MLVLPLSISGNLWLQAQAISVSQCSHCNNGVNFLEICHQKSVKPLPLGMKSRAERGLNRFTLQDNRMGEALTVFVVDSAEMLASMSDEWNRLLDNSSARNVCLSWLWMKTWWDFYGDCGVRLHVLRIEDGGDLVGIVPFFIQKKIRFGFLPVRTLRFLGTGEPEWEEVASEYLDIIARQGYENRVTQAVWDYLYRQMSWDQLVFNDVTENSLILKSFRGLVMEARFVVAQELVGIRYCVELPKGWNEYLAMLDPGPAKRIPYKRRKLERAGRVVEKAVTMSQELDGAFDELIRLHTLRWTAREQTGVFASQRFASFHGALARMLLPLGMLNMRMLSLDGANIAVLYNFRYGATDYFYQGGFDVERAAKYSPGIMAHVYAIEDAIHTGQRRYDFMKGGTVSYKSEFGCAESAMYDMRAFSRTLCGRLLAVEYRLRVLLRPIRKFFRKTDGHPQREYPHEQNQ